MSTTTVFRIEGLDGVGPYNSIHHDGTIEYYLQMAGLHSIGYVSNYQFKGYHLCACPSLNALIIAFGSSMLNYAVGTGNFKIYEIELKIEDVFYTSDDLQVYFEKGAEILKTEVQLIPQTT